VEGEGLGEAEGITGLGDTGAGDGDGDKSVEGDELGLAGRGDGDGKGGGVQYRRTLTSVSRMLLLTTVRRTATSVPGRRSTSVNLVLY
jgi:hypothetical protein